MPRRVYKFLSGREKMEVDCFAYYRNKAGRPCCHALTDIYCLKDYAPCAFRATPYQARIAREKAAARLRKIEERRRAAEEGK